MGHTAMLGVDPRSMIGISTTAVSWVVVSNAGVLVVIVNCTPISPGGIGVAETASDHRFSSFAIESGAEIMLLLRLVNLVLTMPGAVAILRRSREGVAK